MLTKQQFIEIVEKSFKSNLKGLFGSVKDEYGIPYDEVFAHEFQNIYDDIGYFLSEIADKDNFVISLEELTGVMMYRWNCTFKLYNISNMEVFEYIACLILLEIERITR